MSTDLQEREHTIQGQLEALRKYAQDRGYEIVAEYLDDGYSGATLGRPQLDRLRDALRSGEFDIVLFHSPDRLARKAVYQFIVLEELEKAGIRPEFLNYPIDDSPESRMLLGMQGLFAEYDRAKILERTRRGKLQRAREGALVGGHAPYGYRWIKRNEVRRAHLEIDEYQEAVVRRMYHLLVDESHSTWAIARLLTEEGIPTARGLSNGNLWPSTASLPTPPTKGHISIATRTTSISPSRCHRSSMEPRGRRLRSSSRKTASALDAITRSTPIFSGVLSDAHDAEGPTPDTISMAHEGTGAIEPTGRCPPRALVVHPVQFLHSQ